MPHGTSRIRPPGGTPNRSRIARRSRACSSPVDQAFSWTVRNTSGWRRNRSSVQWVVAAIGSRCSLPYLAVSRDRLTRRCGFSKGCTIPSGSCPRIRAVNLPTSDAPEISSYASGAISVSAASVVTRTRTISGECCRRNPVRRRTAALRAVPIGSTRNRIGPRCATIAGSYFVEPPRASDTRNRRERCSCGSSWRSISRQMAVSRFVRQAWPARPVTGPPRPSHRRPRGQRRSRGRVAQVVPVQVRRRQDVVLFRPQEELLEHVVRDDVLDHDLAVRDLAAVRLDDVVPGDRRLSEVDLRDLVAPGAKRALRVLHDVPFVHEGHGLPAVVDRVPDRLPDQTLRAGLADGLDADSAVRAQAGVELLV